MSAEQQVFILKSEHPLKVEVRELIPKNAGTACPLKIDKVVARLHCKPEKLDVVGVWLRKDAWESRSGCKSPVAEHDPRCKQIIYGFQHTDIKMQDDFMYTTDLTM